MNKFINTFVKDEDGAVTVDWVVLTAAIVGLGIAGVAAVSDGVDELAGRISTGVQAVDVEGAPGAGGGDSGADTGADTGAGGS